METNSSVRCWIHGLLQSAEKIGEVTVWTQNLFAAEVVGHVGCGGPQPLSFASRQVIADLGEEHEGAGRGQSISLRRRLSFEPGRLQVELS